MNESIDTSIETNEHGIFGMECDAIHQKYKQFVGIEDKNAVNSKLPIFSPQKSSLLAPKAHSEPKSIHNLPHKSPKKLSLEKYKVSIEGQGAFERQVGENSQGTFEELEGEGQNKRHSLRSQHSKEQPRQDQGTHSAAMSSFKQQAPSHTQGLKVSNFMKDAASPGISLRKSPRIFSPYKDECIGSALQRSEANRRPQTRPFLNDFSNKVIGERKEKSREESEENNEAPSWKLTRARASKQIIEPSVNKIMENGGFGERRLEKSEANIFGRNDSESKMSFLDQNDPSSGKFLRFKEKGKMPEPQKLSTSLGEGLRKWQLNKKQERLVECMRNKNDGGFLKERQRDEDYEERPKKEKKLFRTKEPGESLWTKEEIDLRDFWRFLSFKKAMGERLVSDDLDPGAIEKTLKTIVGLLDKKEGKQGIETKKKEEILSKIHAWLEHEKNTCEKIDGFSEVLGLFTWAVKMVKEKDETRVCVNKEAGGERKMEVEGSIKKDGTDLEAEMKSVEKREAEKLEMKIEVEVKERDGRGQMSLGEENKMIRENAMEIEENEQIKFQEGKNQNEKRNIEQVQCIETEDFSKSPKILEEISSDAEMEDNANNFLNKITRKSRPINPFGIVSRGRENQGLIGKKRTQKQLLIDNDAFISEQRSVSTSKEPNEDPKETHKRTFKHKGIKEAQKRAFKSKLWSKRHQNEENGQEKKATPREIRLQLRNEKEKQKKISMVELEKGGENDSHLEDSKDDCNSIQEGKQIRDKGPKKMQGTQKERDLGRSPSRPTTTGTEQRDSESSEAPRSNGLSKTRILSILKLAEKIKALSLCPNLQTIRFLSVAVEEEIFQAAHGKEKANEAFYQEKMQEILGNGVRPFKILLKDFAGENIRESRAMDFFWRDP